MKDIDQRIAFLSVGGCIGFVLSTSAPFFSGFGIIFGIIGGYTLYNLKKNDNFGFIMSVLVNVLIYYLSCLIPDQEVHKIDFHMEMNKFPVIGFLSLVNILISILSILLKVALWAGRRLKRR